MFLLEEFYFGHKVCAKGLYLPGNIRLIQDQRNFAKILELFN
jgi:hypothetical protein